MYTKEEWRTEIRRDSIFITTNERLVARIVEGKADASEINANAQLISSAPELYEALKEAYHWADTKMAKGEKTDGFPWGTITKALAKTEGK